MRKIVFILNPFLLVSILCAQDENSLVKKNSMEIISGANLLNPIRHYSETFFGEVHGAYNVSPEFTPDNFFLYGAYTKKLFGRKSSFLAMNTNFGYQHYHIKCSEMGYDSGGYLGTYFKGKKIKEWQNDYAVIALLLTHELRINENVRFSNSIGFADNWLLHYLYIEKSYGSTYGNQVVDKQSFNKGWHSPNDGLSQQNEFFIFYRLAGTYRISQFASLGIRLESPLYCFFKSTASNLPMALSFYPTPYFKDLNKLYYLNIGIQLSYKLN